MIQLTPKQINEIAQELELDFKVFVHKTKGDVVVVPDLNHYYDMEEEHWEEEFKLLANKPDDYFEFEKWNANKAIRSMRNFAESVSNERLKNDLMNALHRSKPFRNFKHIIDNAGDYREAWFEYKLQWQMQYVQEQLDGLNSCNAEDDN